MNPPPSFKKNYPNHSRVPFYANTPRVPPARPTFPLEITQEFENQQLGINTTNHSNWKALGARPTVTKFTVSPPTPQALQGKERAAYLYLAGLAQQLKGYDLSQEAERRALLAKNETLIIQAENTLTNSFNSQKFFLNYGNLPIIDVPQDELLFEVKHHLLLNHRELLTDSELSEVLRALTNYATRIRYIYKIIEISGATNQLFSSTVPNSNHLNILPHQPFIIFHPFPQATKQPYR
jgi:hypothetical protein